LLSDASSNTHTLNWRIRRWVESMNTERSLSEWIFGSIFGPTPVTQVGLYGQFSHNAYVNQIEYLGFLGLFVFIVVLLKCYLRIRTLNSSRAPGKALMLSSILFGFTYQIPVAFFFLAPIFTQLAKNFESEIMESKIRENVNWNREIHRYGNTHA
jgi:flagellar biosynthesis protein FliP